MHHSNIPLAGSSPLELLKAGAFIAGQADFDLILPYQVFVVKVFPHENLTYQDHFFMIVYNTLTRTSSPPTFMAYRSLSSS